MEKKFRIKSIRRETEDTIEYIEDFKDCIITVEEVETITENKGCIRCGHEEFWFSRTCNSYGEVDGDVCEKCGQIQSQPVVEIKESIGSDICEQCGGINRCLCAKEQSPVEMTKEILKIQAELNKPKETLADIFIHYWEDCERIGYKNDMNKLAEIGQDYLKDNPDEIDCVPAKELKDELKMAERENHQLREMNKKLSCQSIKHRDDYTKGFKDGFNYKKTREETSVNPPKSQDQIELITAGVEPKLKKNRFEDLIWYLESSMKGMVSHKKVMEKFDYIQTLTHEYGSRKDFMRILRTALENMEKK